MITDYYRDIHFSRFLRYSALTQSKAQKRQMSIDNFPFFKVEERLVGENTGTHLLKGALTVANI